jgi:exodeoxyribonuclease VII small subunit
MAETNGKFEDALAELEGLVQRLEKGELPLEESLAAFERGMVLVRQLGDRLTQVEERVEVLLRSETGKAPAASPSRRRRMSVDVERYLAARAGLVERAPRPAVSAQPHPAPRGDPLQPPRRRQARAAGPWCSPRARSRAARRAS